MRSPQLWVESLRESRTPPVETRAIPTMLKSTPALPPRTMSHSYSEVGNVKRPGRPELTHRASLSSPLLLILRYWNPTQMLEEVLEPEN